MGFSSLHKAIVSQFASNWDATAVPVAYPNRGSGTALIFTPPTDRPYVRFYISDGEPPPPTLGNPDGKNKYRFIGLIVAQICTLGGHGEDAATDLSDSIAAIFRNKHFSGVWSTTPKISIVGNTPDGRYQINVTIPFQRDEVL